MQPTISLLERAHHYLIGGDYTQAEKIASEYLGTHQNEYASWYLMGIIQFRLARYQDAQATLSRAIQLEPKHAELHNCLAATFAALNNFPNAETHYRAALQLMPNHAPYMQNYARLLCDHGHTQNAQRLLDYLLHNLDPNPDTLTLAAEIALREGRLEAAQDLIQHALALAPELLPTLLMAGTIAYNLYNWEAAVEYFTRAHAFHPSDITATTNLAFAENARGQNPIAQAILSHAITDSKPDSPTLVHALALLELSAGDFTTGWRHFLARPSRSNIQYGEPNILPKTLTDKKILVIGDEGLGDEIFFLRYARELLSRGATVDYKTNPKLAPIITHAHIFRNTLVTATADDYDYTLASGDLPYLVGDATLLPRPSPPFIPCDPNAKQNAQAALARCGPPPYIGVTWNAGPYLPNTPEAHTALYKKNCPIDLLGQALGGINATFIVLQRHSQSAELKILHHSTQRDIGDFSAWCDDLNQLYGLLACLDNYVGVSNTNMHLRASLRLPAYVLLNHPAEWRWDMGATSAWFPTFTLLRQQPDGDWHAPLSRLTQQLDIHYGSERA
ncbi:MAG: tetratricopeptide repeat protein [Pseudomonadota bacterium]